MTCGGGGSRLLCLDDRRPEVGGRQVVEGESSILRDGRLESVLHTEGPRHALEIRSSVDEVRRVQEAVRKEMDRLGYDADACFAVKLALEESLVNAMKHGNRFDASHSVHIRYSADDKQVWISVKDDGRGFDPASVPDPTTVENLAKPHGRGIMLMRAYMDDVTYSACGSEVIMVKRKR